jgi:hypothetical protein
MIISFFFTIVGLIPTKINYLKRTRLQDVVFGVGRRRTASSSHMLIRCLFYDVRGVTNVQNNSTVRIRQIQCRSETSQSLIKLLSHCRRYKSNAEVSFISHYRNCMFWKELESPHNSDLVFTQHKIRYPTCDDRMRTYRAPFCAPKKLTGCTKTCFLYIIINTTTEHSSACKPTGKKVHVLWDQKDHYSVHKSPHILLLLLSEKVKSWGC